MARLPNFLVIIRSEKLSGKGQGRGCLGVRKKERFVLGKRTFRSQKSKHFVLRIISDTYSLRVEGEKKWVDQTKCTVKDGVLLIAWAEKGKKTTRNVNGLSIYISAPDLQKVAFEGVGSFNCKSRLNLKDVKFDVEGVGSLHVTDLRARNVQVSLEGVGSGELAVDCEHLDASIEGVGSLTLSGKAKSAQISKDGIGSVSTRRLKVGE